MTEPKNTSSNRSRQSDIFSKATANVASVYLNKGGKDNFKRAYEIILPAWEDSDKKHAGTFEVLIWSIYHHTSAKEAIQYYEQSEEGQKLVEHHGELLAMMAGIYAEQEVFNKANDLVERAVDLSPSSAQVLATKARILISRSLKEKIVPSVFEVVPRFRDYQGIEKALTILHRALQLADADKSSVLVEQIRSDIVLCSLWLRRAQEAKYREMRKAIRVEALDEFRQHQLRIHDLGFHLEGRNFEMAYNVLVNSGNWDTIPYAEKVRVARIFLLRGSPERAKDILRTLESEANQKKDAQLWLDMSQIEILLENKNLAIAAVEKGKKLAEGTEIEKEVMSHFNAVMLRFARHGEVDRFMKGVFEYQRKYPGDKIARPVRALDQDGELTGEMKSILEDRHKWYERMKEMFRSQPVPSYALEGILHRPYADILSTQDDPGFTIELTSPAAGFEKQLLDDLEGAPWMVFDYAALLNLSKMNLLGHLPRFGKGLSIAKELFDKIQNELLSFEHEDLRRLWQFLRTSKEVDLVEETAGQPPIEDVSDILGKWVVPSMRQAKTHNAVFIADDLRFLLFLRSEKIKGCNTLVMLKYMLKKGWIDPKIYSTSLGDLAERCYVFLSFSGEDLYQIAMEDEAKITLRSYHLVNQLLLTGSNLGSFIAVFVKFIDLVWKTGSLPEDKVSWLRLLSNKIKEFVDKHDLAEKAEEHTSIINSLLMMWSLATQGSSKDEIALLEKRAGEVFDKPYLGDLAGKIRVVIERRKEELSPEPSK